MIKNEQASLLCHSEGMPLRKEVVEKHQTSVSQLYLPDELCIWAFVSVTPLFTSTGTHKLETCPTGARLCMFSGWGNIFVFSQPCVLQTDTLKLMVLSSLYRNT